MEVATINWKDSKFEKDELYEHIDAPQWIDFSANHPPPPIDDDDAWFCRPDCNHPKTVDDFFIKTVPNPSKLQKSANVSEICPVSDQNQRPFSNTLMKKRGTPMNKNLKSIKHVQDNENQNPNVFTPDDHRVKLSAEEKKKKKAENSCSVSEEAPRKPRNLFAGNNILNQITEFCNELKRLATRTKQRGDEHGEKESEQKKPGAGVLKEREAQRKPLLEAIKVKDEDMEKSSSNGKDKLTRKILNTGLENSPIAETTKSRKGKAEKRVFQILTTKVATPPKGFPN